MKLDKAIEIETIHNDHNPSLSVNREKGLWHCFGCGRGGDVLMFIEEWQQR